MIHLALHILNMSVNVLLALMFVLSGLATRVSPETWIIPSFFSLGFGILGVLNLFFVIYWMIRRKWNFVLSLACLVLMSDVINYQFLLFGNDEEKAEGKNITLLSYNVQLFNLYRQKDGSNDIISFILDKDVDIVCLQEFGWYNEKGFVSQSVLNRTLGDRYPYCYAITDPNFGGRATYGIATYSKFPIINRDSVRYPTHYNRTSTCDILVGNDTLHIVNCHLESNLLTNDDRKLVLATLDSTNQHNLNKTGELLIRKMGKAAKTRAKQADAIAAHVKKQAGRKVIVCGDLNDHPASYTYHKTRGELCDAFLDESEDNGLGITYNEFPFFYRIDYLFHSKSLKVEDFETGTEKLSDHYPIEAKILLNP